MSRAISKRRHWTVEGRIVYERPKHLFTYSRAIRILGKVDWTKETLQDINRSVDELSKIYLNILARGIELSGGDSTFLINAGTFAAAILYKLRDAAAGLLKYVWDTIKGLIQAVFS